MSEQPEQETVHKHGADRSSYVPALKAGQTRHCTDPWTFVQVLGNGQTRPCCFSGVILGFVSDDVSLDEIYNGEVAQKLRRELLTGELDEYCRICNMKSVVPVKDFQQAMTQMYEEGGLIPSTRKMPVSEAVRKTVQDDGASLYLSAAAIPSVKKQSPVAVLAKKISQVKLLRAMAKAVLPYSVKSSISRLING